MNNFNNEDLKIIFLNVVYILSSLKDNLRFVDFYEVILPPWKIQILLKKYRLFFHKQVATDQEWRRL